MKWQTITVAILSTTLFFCPKKSEEPAPTTGTQATTSAPTEQATVNYVAIDPSVFQSEDTINSWINATPINQGAIDAHRWALWGAMTKPSGQTLNGTPLPVWETWYDTTTVFANAQVTPSTLAATKNARLADLTGIHEKRRFTRPVQLVKKASGKKTATGAELSGVVLAFNRFTEEMRDHIWNNQYYNSDVLTALNTNFNNNSTPIAQRTIKAFPNHSIMMKPVFWLASATTTTMMPYWAGTASHATADGDTMPTPDKWKQCVLLDPTGNADNSKPQTCNNIQVPAGGYNVVRISADPSQSGLYAFKLTAEEVTQLNTLLGPDLGLIYGLKTLEAGDFAVFVAAHVATREIANWTWQTFWYSPDPNMLPAEPPNIQAAPASIPPPWNNYVSCNAYYMVTPPNSPNGSHYHCYNPYLETGLNQLENADQSQKNGYGIQTNCMTCHRAAVWNPSGPSGGPPYATDFQLNPDNPTWFTGATKLEFSWATQGSAHTGPFNPPPGGSSAAKK